MIEEQDRDGSDARHDAGPTLRVLFLTVLAMVFVTGTLQLVVIQLAGVDVEDPAARSAFAVTLPMLAVAILGYQLLPAASALLSSRRSGRPLTVRLGLGPGRLRPATAVCLAAGSLFISWPVEHLLVALGVEAGPNLDGIVRAVQAHPWLALVAFSAIPGVCEELFFRGFVQRGLERAWRPAAAILLPAVVFGLVHGDPLQSPVAGVLGAWFGFLAWRSGSIRVAIYAHVLNNFVVALALGRIELGEGGYAAFLTHPVLTAIGTVSGVFLLVGLWLLRRENRDEARNHAPGRPSRG